MSLETYFSLRGKIILITGAASGLGEAIGRATAGAGAHVVLADINGEGANLAAQNMCSQGFSASSEQLDVCDASAITAVVKRIVAQYGRLDVVFANAGISGGPGPLSDNGNLAASAMQRWTRVLDVNLTSVFSTIKAAAIPMRQQKWGRIIITTSSAGLRADPMVGYSYVATKAAVINLTRQAAIDLARDNVMVNAIAPGPFKTNIGNGRMHDNETEQQFVQKIPLARLGHPHEIGGAAIFLASEAASFITGAVIAVDGGATAW